MTDGQSDPSEDAGNPEDGPILSPEELDIGEDDHVTEIDEGRYVVSPEIRDDADASPGAGTVGGSSADPASEHATDAPEEPSPSPPTEPTGGGRQPPSTRDASTGELSEQAVHAWLEHSLADSPSRYSFDVTAKFDDAVTQRRMASNDVVTIFQSLMLWYAQGIDRQTPVEEVLGILLMESNVPVRFPAASLQRLLQSTDLSREDSVGDLLDTVEERDGFRL